jgi:hypothetical protein
MKNDQSVFIFPAAPKFEAQTLWSNDSTPSNSAPLPPLALFVKKRIYLSLLNIIIGYQNIFRWSPSKYIIANNFLHKSLIFLE